MSTIEEEVNVKVVLVVKFVSIIDKEVNAQIVVVMKFANQNQLSDVEQEAIENSMVIVATVLLISSQKTLEH